MRIAAPKVAQEEDFCGANGGVAEVSDIKLEVAFVIPRVHFCPWFITAEM